MFDGTVQSRLDGRVVDFRLFHLNVQAKRDLHIPFRLLLLLLQGGIILGFGNFEENLFQLVEVIVVAQNEARLELG